MDRWYAGDILWPTDKGRGQKDGERPVFVAAEGATAAASSRALADGGAHDVVGAGDLVEVLLPGVFGQRDIGADAIDDLVAESGDLVQGIGVLLGPGTQHREGGQGPAWGRCSEDAAGVFWWEPSPQAGAMMKQPGMATCCWGGRAALRCGTAPGSSDFRQVNSCW